MNNRIFFGEYLVDRRWLLIALADKIFYDRNHGFRTAAFSQPFSLLADLREGNNEMVGLGGLEPPRPQGQRILSPQRLPFRHRPA